MTEPATTSPHPLNDEASAARVADRVTRRGRVSWSTHPPSGTARVESQSRAFGALPVTLPEGEPDSQEATPGELLAITHAMFLAAALSERLRGAGSPANEIVVEAACTFSGRLPDRELIAVDLDVQGRVPGLDATHFRRAVEEARRESLRSAGAREDLPGELHPRLEP
ncbi:MAG TPA: hypothetical protein VMB05_04590 [Solirubrobacteraceae bacterium]|nr:hypothetical protein [Solirubrobacteraceae bacterium]